MADPRHGRRVESDEALREALLSRAQEAIRAAATIVARSQFITHVSSDLRGGALTSRCAWCGRYRVGDEWVGVGPSAMVDLAATTHGICEDCVDALRRAGLSV